MLGLKHAFRGVFLMFRSERNFKIQFLLFIILCITCQILEISPIEWAILLTLSAVVFSLEVINSAIEKTCDSITEEYSSNIKDIKDISAAAVLIAAVFSAIIALIILLPYIGKLF